MFYPLIFILIPYVLNKKECEPLEFTRFVTSLEPNEVFVFGSNEAGRHGRGAAKLALKFGAKYGKGIGISGQTYGIPTKDSNIKTLHLGAIQGYVQDFKRYVKKHPEKKFIITEIGCGLAGFKPEQIAPMFKEIKDLPNITLPKKFWSIINN